MRISTKVSLALLVASIVTFGGVSAIQLWIEKRDLEATMIAEATKLGRVAAEGVQRELSEHAREDAMELIARIETFDRAVDIVYWQAQPDQMRGAGPGSMAPELLREVARRAHLTGKSHARISTLADGRRVAVVGSPVDAPGGEGAVVLFEPLDDIDADLRREALMMTLGVLVFSLVGSGLAYMLGEIYIGRPLARLELAMTRVETGDFAQTPLSARADEVGSVTRHFETLRARLETTRQRLSDERREHRAALERLAHADRLASIGQLAAGLAHEVGSPLQILVGRSRVLADLAPPDSEIHGIATTISTQLERVTGIVRRHIDFSRPPEGRRRAGEIRATVAPILDLLAVEARGHHVELRLHVDAALEPPTLVLADHDALEQVLFNLVRNAIDASPPRGVVELRLGLEPDPSGSGSARRADELVMEVLDQGTGIDPSIGPRLFDPFVTTKDATAGAGLGLSVVRYLVDAAGGKVEARPRAPRGTVFTVTLPVELETAAPEASQDPTGTPGAAGSEGVSQT